jgi:hypothetical protein
MPRIISSVTRAFEGRIAASAIVGFVMFSATFAVTTLVSASQAQGLPPMMASPEVVAAETDVRELVDERMHLHLKRLHGLSGALAGTGATLR